MPRLPVPEQIYILSRMGITLPSRLAPGMRHRTAFQQHACKGRQGPWWRSLTGSC